MQYGQTNHQFLYLRLHDANLQCLPFKKGKCCSKIVVQKFNARKKNLKNLELFYYSQHKKCLL